jgi:hypothetical protein
MISGRYIDNTACTIVREGLDDKKIIKNSHVVYKIDFKLTDTCDQIIRKIELS